VFDIFRSSFSRQFAVLSVVPDTVLGVRPTEELFVWCLTFFALRLPDRSPFRQLNPHPKQPNAKKIAPAAAGAVFVFH